MILMLNGGFAQVLESFSLSRLHLCAMYKSKDFSIHKSRFMHFLSNSPAQSTPLHPAFNLSNTSQFHTLEYYAKTTFLSD